MNCKNLVFFSCLLGFLLLNSGCTLYDDNFIVLRFKAHDFNLFVENADTESVTFQGALVTNFDGNRIYELVGTGKVIVANRTIEVKEDRLIFNTGKVLDLNSKLPLNMILKKDGSLEQGFLRTFI